MKNRLFVATALGAGLLLVSHTALPHHGANLYDTTRAVVLKGTVTKFVWGNPHNQIFFDVTDGKGEVAHWVASTGFMACCKKTGGHRPPLQSGHWKEA